MGSEMCIRDSFITISTAGNAEDFGDMTTGHQSRAAFASATRGIFAGGYVPSGTSTAIDYVTISSKGGANDFGDTVISRQNCMGFSDSTRGIYGDQDIHRVPLIIQMLLNL